MLAEATAIPYGSDERQCAWLRPAPGPGPLLVVVPGGGWAHGNPEGAFASAAVAWGRARGMHVAVVSHRLLPAAGPLAQAEDVACAIAAVQAASTAAAAADPARQFVLAHSAGAHLAALVHVGALQARVPALRPWQASVLLDTAALDVPQLMRWPHAPLHDRAFGADPEAWPAMSPLHAVRGPSAPVLLAFGEDRPGAAIQAARFAQALRRAGGQAEVHPVPLAHHRMGDGLADGGVLAGPIDRFLAGLPSAAARPHPSLPRR